MFHVYSVDPSPLFYQSVREVGVLFISGEPVQRVHPPTICTVLQYTSLLVGTAGGEVLSTEKRWYIQLCVNSLDSEAKL